ncbi:MAG: 30S ribosomal protein S16 [Bdellovibrionales bacterium]|nr:30S ribosomal protein S16 [Bdellovibrionales bacterium]
MAIALRLARHGQKKRPFYRIIAAEKEARRNGRFLDIVGTYNPMVNPPAVTLKEDKIRQWVMTGAKPSLVVRNMINKNIPGLLQEKEDHQRGKIVARRANRRAKMKTKKAATKK